MKLTPVMTEKSMSDAKKGQYTFMVEKGLTKTEIKALVNKVYDVHVVGVRTTNNKAEVKKNMRGIKVTKKASKKAWVSLAAKEKIDVFEEKTK